jgi:hypothetical protein
MKRFNDAMVVYLECLNELDKYLSKQCYISQKSNDFKYELTKDMINGICIQFDYNNPDNWSKCMKSLLIILNNYIFSILKKESDELKNIADS